MTIPMPYQRAKEVFESFLSDAQEALHMPTRNPTYTCVQGVFVTFRRRLEAEQVLTFAAALPPLLRALFVDGWLSGGTVEPFRDRAAMEREVQSWRKNHNLTPDGCIAIVAEVLRLYVDAAEFDRVLAQMPEGSADFWRGPE